MLLSCLDWTGFPWLGWPSVAGLVVCGWTGHIVCWVGLVLPMAWLGLVARLHGSWLGSGSWRGTAPWLGSMVLFGSSGPPRGLHCWHWWFAEVTDVAGADVDVLTGLVSLGDGLLPLVPELVEDTNLEVVHRLLLDTFDQMGVELLVVECGICLFVVPSSEVFVDDVRSHSVVLGGVAQA